MVSFFLAIIGAINWLLVGIVKFDMVRWIFGRNNIPSRTVYNLVGVAGLTQLVLFFTNMFRRQPMPMPVT